MTIADEEGVRDGLGTAEVHDAADGTHEVVVDFPHEVIDTYRTDWARGCFDESLGRLLPPMVWNHDPADLIGRATRHENLGRLTRIVSRFSDFDAVPRARQAFAQIQAGDVPGFSFHFKNGQSVPHPDVRGARRFVKADMLEISPVTFPSIPGAKAVGIRRDGAQDLEVPTVDEILRLKETGILDADGCRALLGERWPSAREHITVTSTTHPAPTSTGGVATGATVDLARLVELVKAATPESGTRDITITVAHDGTMSMGAQQDPGGDVGDTDDDPATLAAAVDAALDQAQTLLDGVDVTELPDQVQQSLALQQAAGVAVDELLEVMGIDDPDSDGNRAAKASDAPWNFNASDYTPSQLKAACLVVDGDGSTKDDCHLPVRTPDGVLNRNAVHAAAAALAGARGGIKMSADDKKTAAAKLISLYTQLGEQPPDSLKKLAGSGARSDDDLDKRMVATLARLQQR